MEDEPYVPPTDEQRAAAEGLVAGAEEADEAEERAREFLSRHTDLLGPDLIELIADREREQVFRGRAAAVLGPLATGKQVEDPRT